MSNCLACELSVKECICSAVDAFFGSTLPTRAPEPVLVALPTPDQTWFIRPAKAMAALLAVCLVGTSCGALKGKDGASGAGGKDGVSIVGHTGAVGPKGDSGDKGPKGDTGSTGDTGAQGPKGDQGIAGPQGVTGASGAPAEPCTTQAVLGGVVVTCPDNSSQVILNGTNGVDGHDGTPGTVITPVQLCANYVTTYPSTFPEFAFNIAGKLYAVYWDGSHAFMAYIPPGAYSSTSPQGCNFTVNADNSITEN